MKLIVAVDNKWGIGRDNKLLCNIPEDMAFFVKQTTHKTIIMGRNTYESLPKRPLPNRNNIVLTSNLSYDANGAEVANSYEDMYNLIANDNPEDVYVIGGAKLYNDLIAECDELYITKILADLNADTFIVDIDKLANFVIMSESEIKEHNGIKYQFVKYIKK